MVDSINSYFLFDLVKIQIEFLINKVIKFHTYKPYIISTANTIAEVVGIITANGKQSNSIW